MDGDVVSALPKWVYDLVMNLQQQQSEHPELLHRTADGHYAKLDR